jgi:CBS domain-containing protein
MVSPVITVAKNATVRDVAKILLEKRISAVPVVDNSGKVIGIVTESDLMHRVEAGTERPYSWWVKFLAGDATIAADYVKSHAEKVEDVMTSGVVTASPEMPLHEIASLLEEREIKHVPIIGEDGSLVGIVSRANLIQAVASARPRIEMTLPDLTVRKKLLDELRTRPWAHLGNLNVIVTNGVVDLWGFVGSGEERKAIRVAAEAVPGVTRVNDHLTDRSIPLY